MKNVALLFGLVALALPQLVSYQGRLIDDQGNPFEGQAQVEFRVAFGHEAQLSSL